MKIGVLFPSRVDDPGEFLADARAMEAAGVHSIWLQDETGGYEPLLLLAAVAAVTVQLRLGLFVGSGSWLDSSAKRRHLSQDRLVTDAERWQQASVPTDREDWAKTLDRAKDAEGVIVPMDPRLLDILRHPDEEIDRSDLILAQG